MIHHLWGLEKAFAGVKNHKTEEEAVKQPQNNKRFNQRRSPVPKMPPTRKRMEILHGLVRH